MTNRVPLRSSRALGGTVTFRLHTLAKLTDRVSQAAYLAEAGLPLGEGRCLSAIGSFRPLSVVDLAAAANLDKGQASPTDGRGVVLTLSAKGERIWQRVMDLVERRNAEITGCLSSTERAQLDRLLDRLVAHARIAVE